MGMFDSIYLEEGVECPCGTRVHDFQSKDFDCLLEQFTINKDGTISAEDYRMTEIPPSERNEFGFPFCKKELLGFYNLDITDTINIYSSCPQGRYWIDIDLMFVEGKMVNKEVRITEME